MTRPFHPADAPGWLKQYSQSVERAMRRKPSSRTLTASGTVGKDDEFIIADATAASVTITLPPVADAAGAVIRVKKINAANSVILDGAASETIDGATTKTLTAQWASTTVYCDGAAWYAF